MAIQLQLRTGTTSENNNFTGAAGELSYDTQTHALRVHDGVKMGGRQIDTVVDYQLPTAANGYTWYRKYASGWVEQGGIQTGTGIYGKVTVYLPVTMADNTYQAFGNIGWVAQTAWYTSSGYTDMQGVTDVTGATTDKTTTSFSIQGFSVHNWYVCGMAA